jgi:hypothetical protein
MREQRGLRVREMRVNLRLKPLTPLTGSLKQTEIIIGMLFP